MSAACTAGAHATCQNVTMPMREASRLPPCDCLCHEATPAATGPAPNTMNDDGYLLLAVADDFYAKFPPDDGSVHPDDVYDWLIAQAHEIGAQS